MFESLPGLVGMATESRADPVEANPPEGEPTGGTLTAEAVIQSVLDGLCYPIFTVDAEGHIDRINDEALDLFEKTRDDLIGVCLFDLDEADNTVMREVLDTGEPVQNLEDTIEVESGVKPVSRSLMPIHDDAGDVVGALEINREISERVELREREELLESYQETAVGELQRCLARLSEGDLTVDPTIPEPDERFEAIDNVYRRFDGMATDLGDAVESLRGALRQARRQSDELTDNGEEMQAACSEVTKTIADINDATDSVTTSAERQASKANQAEDNVANLSAAIEEITATVQQIDERSTDAADLAVEGTDTAHDAIESIDEASAASERNMEKMESLEDQMATIDQMTQMIADIADQTNLLALNANIEAARADGDGSGFQVVANEVKELAEESKSAVDEISKSLEELKAGVTETADAIEESNRQVESGVGAVRTVVENIEDIETAVREVNEGIEEIRHATNDQAQNAEEVAQLVEDVSVASDDVSAEMQEVASRIDLQSAAVGEVSDISGEVAEMSDVMNGTLSEFRLDGDAASD